MRNRVWTAIIVSGFGWGTEGVTTRAIFNQNVGPYSVAMLRAVIAAIASYVFLGVTGGLRAPDRVLWRQGVVQGIAHLAGPFLFLTFAYQHASAGFISLLVAMVPLITAMLAHFALPEERFGARMIVGFLIAAAGAAVLVTSGESGLATGGQPLLGSLLALGAAFCIAGSAVYARRDAGRYDAVQLTALQMVIGAVILAAVVPFIGDVQLDLEAKTWALLIFLAVGATVVPYFAFFWATNHASAILVSLSGYVAPLVAVVLGVLLLDEQLHTSIVVGGLLILAGVIIADRAERTATDVDSPQPFSPQQGAAIVNRVDAPVWEKAAPPQPAPPARMVDMDVQRYLARIGLDSPGDVGVASLERLQRAHLTTVPFENLHVYYRRGVRTDEGWSTQKIVDGGRGGWCFELNGAFAALLEAIGYQVTRLAAVVLLEGDDGYPSHLTLRVDLDRPYLVDVGFGDAFTKPLPLDHPGPHHGGTAFYGFETVDGWTKLMEFGPDDAAVPVYRFTHTPRDLASFDEQSTRLQTDLTLKWTRSRFATRLLDNGPDRVTLVEDKLRFRRHGVWEDHAVQPDDWAATLDEWFDLTIP